MKRVWFGLSLVLDLSLKWVRNISKMCFILVAVGVKIHTAHHNQITNFASCFKEQRAKLLVRFVYCFPIHLSNGLHLLFQRSCVKRWCLLSMVVSTSWVIGCLIRQCIHARRAFTWTEANHCNARNLDCGMQHNQNVLVSTPEGTCTLLAPLFLTENFFSFFFWSSGEKEEAGGRIDTSGLALHQKLLSFSVILFLYFFSFTLLKHIDLG